MVFSQTSSRSGRQVRLLKARIRAMDTSALSWLDEMDLESSSFGLGDEWDDLKDLFDEDDISIVHQNLDACVSAVDNPSSAASTTKSPEIGPAPPAKLQKHNNKSGFSSFKNRDGASSSPIILNFGNEGSDENGELANSRLLNPDPAVSVRISAPEEQSRGTQSAKKTSRSRPASQTYDHIIAERKRREQLSQRFVALSTIVPGLKKMDKTSVLGDAIEYLKHLQERVKTLEENAAKQTPESMVFVRKSRIMLEDGGSSDEKNGSVDEQPLPEVAARVCNSHILVRVHSEIQKGLLVNLLSHVEKLHLAVMEKEFKLTAKEVVKRLRAALQGMV